MIKKPEQLQKISFITHGAQGAFLFITFIVILVVKAQKGADPGQTNFMFALCFLSVPAIIYLAMTPRFPRTLRFANPYIFAVVGVIFTIMWFAAFIAVAASNQRGINEGTANLKNATGNNTGAGTCAVTSIGSPKSCQVAKAAIGFGAVVFILFAITTGIMCYLVYYLWTSSLPWDYYITTAGTQRNQEIEATTQDAFSHKDDPREMNLDPEDDEHGHVQGESSNYAPLDTSEQHYGRVNPAVRYDDVDESGYRTGHVHQSPQHDNEQVDFPEGPYEPEEFGGGQGRQIHGGSDRGRGYNY